MLTDDQISEILLPLMPLKDPYTFARAIEDMVCAECVPPGYVVVPMNPTRTHIMAAHDGPLAAGEYTITAEIEAWLIEMYKAMLPTAPGITTPTAKDKP